MKYDVSKTASSQLTVLLSDLYPWWETPRFFHEVAWDTASYWVVYSSHVTTQQVVEKPELQP